MKAEMRASLVGLVLNLLVACRLTKALDQTLPIASLKPSKVHSALERIQVSNARDQAFRDEVTLRVDDAAFPWITVTWAGVMNPQYDDWVALYVPFDANVTQTAPAKFKYAVESLNDTHMRHGSGLLRFKLINYRRDVAFAFLRGGLMTPIRIAISAPLRVAHPNQPLHGHLALTSNPKEMIIQWATWNASRPIVLWGTDRHLLKHMAAGSTHTVTQDEMCGGVAAGWGWVDPGVFHIATMTGLEPGKRYYYQFGDPVTGWSDMRSFLAPPLRGRGYLRPHPSRAAPTSATPTTRKHVHPHSTAPGTAHLMSEPAESVLSVSGPVPGAAEGAHLGSLGRSARALLGRAAQPGVAGDAGKASAQEGLSAPCGVDGLFTGQETVRVLLIGDMGQAEEDGSNSLPEAMWASLNTTRLLNEEGDSYSLLLNVGDLAYSRGYSTQWDNFLQQTESIASRMPHMVLPGNQERDWPGTNDRFNEILDSGGECGIAYERRYCMPTSAPDRMWYSFYHGPIHFLTYSTEHSTAPGGPQYNFIQQDLAAVDRSVTPWLVVAGHRPIYVSSINSVPPDGDQLVAAQLQTELEPLLLKHKVDLTLHGHHHTYQRTCPMANNTCLGYDSQGVALGPVHLVIGNAGAGLHMNYQDPPPPWLDASMMWWGYARMQASRTTMAIEVISDLDGGIADTLVLQKPGSH